VRNTGNNGNRNGSRIMKMISFVLLRLITILLCLAQSCTLPPHCDIWVLWHQEGWVICKLIVSSLLLDNEFKYWDKTRNNVGPKPEPCTKPRLDDSNLETAPLKWQTCWRADRNDPIQWYIYYQDNDTSAVHRLRSSTTQAGVVKPTRTQFGRRAFSVASPDIWNSLPPKIRLTENFATFKKTQNSSVWHCFF